MPPDAPSDTRAPGNPRPLAWVDGQVVPAGEATVPLLDEGFLRGDAVFEAVLVRSGRTFALEPHLRRLRRSGEAVDLPVPSVHQLVTDLLTAWGEQDGVLRVVVTRGGNVRGILAPVGWPASLSLAVVDIPWRSVLTGVKTLSYAVNQWAVRQARSLGADDALVVDGDTVLELPTGTLCLITDGRITTPDPARLPILDSVTMRTLSEVVAIEPAIVSLDDVLTAEELFVVSATRPVLPVDGVVLDGSRVVGFPAPGSVTGGVRSAYAAHIEASLDPLP